MRPRDIVGGLICSVREKSLLVSNAYRLHCQHSRHRRMSALSLLCTSLSMMDAVSSWVVCLHSVNYATSVTVTRRQRFLRYLYSEPRIVPIAHSQRNVHTGTPLCDRDSRGNDCLYPAMVCLGRYNHTTLCFECLMVGALQAG